MKQRKLFLSLSLFLLAMLAGCSNEFEDVFDSANKEAISPVETLTANSDMAVLQHDYPRLEALVASVIGEVFKSSDPVQKTGAIVINDSSALKDVISPDGDEWHWPAIDFEKYSLVIGNYEVVQSNIFVADQRILQKKDDLVLYLELGCKGDVWDMFGGIQYFATLFPKLPDLPVEVKVWKSYLNSIQ